MRRAVVMGVVAGAVACGVWGSAALGQGDGQSDDTVVGAIRAQAEALAPLVESDAARAFLDATKALPTPPTRTVYSTPDRSASYTQAEYDALPEGEREGLRAREVDAGFYYFTGYGSPLVYVRPLDLVARRWEAERGEPGEHEPTVLAGKRILEFGYGSIGQLRLEASLGATATGVDVETLFGAMYTDDAGEVPGVQGAPDGRVTIVTGQWPADEKTARAVKAEQGEGYDLFITKNTLKLGYIHPKREVDPRFLVHLGVDDDAFLDAVRASLKEGGYFMIYNICPAQTPEGEAYLPHADGECPFPREQMEAHGFDVLEYNRVDTGAVLDIWAALGYDEGKPREEVGADLFAWYTLVRKTGGGGVSEGAPSSSRVSDPG